MTKPLPDIIAVICPNDCWIAVSRDRGTQRLRASDFGALIRVADGVPLVPQIEPQARLSIVAPGLTVPTGPAGPPRRAW